jgi:hypothetical protein
MEQRTIEPTLSLATKVGLIVWGGWTAVMLVLLVLVTRDYQACMADDGWFCFDLRGPVIVAWALGSVIGWVAGWAITIAVRALRRRGVSA